MKEIHEAKKAIKKAEAVVSEAEKEEPYLQLKDVAPNISILDTTGMDPQRAKEFEDAFVRKMLNEVGDPSLPPVPPRRNAPRPRGRPRTRQPYQPKYKGRTPQVSPKYEGLYPQTDQEWENFARIMMPNRAHPEQNIGGWKRRLIEDGDSWLDFWPQEHPQEWAEWVRIHSRGRRRR